MDTIFRDLRFALRVIRKRPLVTLVAVLCLGLGIGATTVVFSLVNGVLLRPLPYEDSEGIYMLWLQFPGSVAGDSPASGKEYEDFRAETQIFETVGGLIVWYFNETSLDPPQRLLGGRFSASAFRMLGVAPAFGRIYTEEEEARGERLVVITHSLWQSVFGGDPDVLGRTLTLSQAPYTVIGVMPPRFRAIPAESQLFVPLVPNPRIPRHIRGVLIFARLADGVSPQRAQVDLDELAERFAQDYPELYPEGWGLRLVSLHENEVGEVRFRLLAFFGAVALVLVIACVNVANLLLAQATAREKEVALRTVFGADRWRLVRQHLTESVVLALLGGLLGLALAYFGTRLIVDLQRDAISRIGEVTIDGRVLAFAVAVSVLTGIVFGLAPALRVSVVHLHETLKQGGKTSAASSRHPLRSILVVIEIALAVLVLIGAGLMIRTFRHLQDVDPGFRTGDVVTMQLFLPRPAYFTEAARVGFYQRLRQGLLAVPGVEAAGLVSGLPFDPGGLYGPVLVDGVDPDDPGPDVEWRQASPEYFAAMGIPLLQGRLFDERDHAESPPVVIVDAALAARLWPGDNPIGQRLKPLGGFHDEWREVVGVVGRVRQHELAELSEMLYMPYAQYASPQIALALHTALDPATVAAAVRAAAREADPNQPVGRLRTIDEMVAGALSGSRFNLLLFAFFGAAALLLAALGVYGVMAYSVAQRRREIGVRCALGAQRSDVVKLVLRQGMTLVGLGLALGLALAWLLAYLLSRLLAGMVHGVAATDFLTFALVALFLVATALAACLVPAVRAVRIDPIATLREE